MLTGPLDPASNRATWSVLYELRDGETNEPIDLSAVDAIELQVREKGAQMLAASLGNGIEIVDDGVFKWTFSKEQMSRLCGGRTYDIGVTLEQAGETMQLLIGSVPVLEGVVR